MIQHAAVGQYPVSFNMVDLAVVRRKPGTPFEEPGQQSEQLRLLGAQNLKKISYVKGTLDSLTNFRT